jgi:hypothetical protein
MKPLLLFVILIAHIQPVMADQILQFGMIYPSDFKAGAVVHEGSGSTIQTLVIVNLGTASFNLQDIRFSSFLVSTTTPVNPDVRVPTTFPNFVLMPGQAYGYINGDFFQQPTLEYVQSIFPSVTSVTVNPDTPLYVSFVNPLGSGVDFQNSQSVVHYQLSIGGASVNWTTTYEMGYPDLQPGFTSGTLGNTTSNAVLVPTTVSFTFSGFFPPISNPPVLNMAKAGQAIAVKFSLHGNQGLNIFVTGYPKSQEVRCDTDAPLNDAQATDTAGGSSLTYDPSTDQYTYAWKTAKSWGGTCRQLIVQLTNGTDHVANFQFK